MQYIIHYFTFLWHQVLFQMSHRIVRYCFVFLINFSACFQVTQHTLLCCTCNLEGLHTIIKTPKNYVNPTASLKSAVTTMRRNLGQTSRVLVRMSAFTSRVCTDPRHSSIPIESIRWFGSEIFWKMASLSCLPLKHSQRKRDVPRSNLHALDVEMSSPMNDSYFRRHGCLDRMLHCVHTGATLWATSLTLSRENISRSISGGRSAM
jgi:hypothetical protein